MDALFSSLYTKSMVRKYNLNIEFGTTPRCGAVCAVSDPRCE